MTDQEVLTQMNNLQIISNSKRLLPSSHCWHFCPTQAPPRPSRRPAPPVSHILQLPGEPLLTCDPSCAARVGRNRWQQVPPEEVGRSALCAWASVGVGEGAGGQADLESTVHHTNHLTGGFRRQNKPRTKLRSGHFSSWWIRESRFNEWEFRLLIIKLLTSLLDLSTWITPQMRYVF